MKALPGVSQTKEWNEQGKALLDVRGYARLRKVRDLILTVFPLGRYYYNEDWPGSHPFTKQARLFVFTSVDKSFITFDLFFKKP